MFCWRKAALSVEDNQPCLWAQVDFLLVVAFRKFIGVGLSRGTLASAPTFLLGLLTGRQSPWEKETLRCCEAGGPPPFPVSCLSDLAIEPAPPGDLASWAGTIATHAPAGILRSAHPACSENMRA